MPARSLSREGVALYAAAAPCNLGINSLVYAADIFIPLVDLDQRHRCTIRSAVPPEPEGGEDGRTYKAWRIARAIYEILGWIVTSLTILTITGVMRRDLER